jgi:hypothetical protein
MRPFDHVLLVVVVATHDQEQLPTFLGKLDVVGSLLVSERDDYGMSLAAA